MPLGQNRPRELDRRQWAGIDRLMYEFQAKGRGEYFFEEPIYFGTAFASPPTLSYSTVTSGFGGPVIPFRTTPPSEYVKNVDANHLGNHSQGTNGVILDPGFEVQGMWVPLLGDGARYIPVTSDLPNLYKDPYPANHSEAWWGNWPNVIWGEWEDGGYTDYGFFERVPGFANNWIQTDDSRGRWSVSEDRPHDYGVGPAGGYSAKYTFTEDGASNWLIPLGWEDQWVEWLGGDIPSTCHWGFYSQITWGGSSVQGTATPPIAPGWEGTAAVWSEEDCELEVWYYSWWDPISSEYDEESIAWDYEAMPKSFDDPEPLLQPDFWLPTWRWTPGPYRVASMSSNDTVTVPIKGGGWNDVSYYLQRGRNQWQQPSIPPGHPLFLSGPGWQCETFRYRINGGSTGQVVYLDNVYTWPDIRNIYVPMVTVGVAEWVVDEQGAYIGVKPWIKVGDP